MALAITKVMRVSGAETTSVCASVFIGQTEAPLTVRPYIPRMTESELLTMMIGGMAHIAGGVLAAYVGMLGGGDPAQQAFYAKHLLAASIMAAPATLVVAKMLIPETGEPLTRGTVKMEVEKTASNIIDAAAAGAADGLKLALNIAAMLLAFIALIAMINWPLTWIGEVTGLAKCAGQADRHRRHPRLVLAPLAWVIGVPWQDASTVGGLIGQKVVINEFVAYLQLADIVNGVAGRGADRPGRADRDLRAVRLRQLQLDRDPDRRHRRTGAGASRRPRPLRPARGAGRLHRHLHDRRRDLHSIGRNRGSGGLRRVGRRP
jgi:CNT family concentrative nucleoside transporter